MLGVKEALRQSLSVRNRLHQLLGIQVNSQVVGNNGFFSRNMLYQWGRQIRSYATGSSAGGGCEVLSPDIQDYLCDEQEKRDKEERQKRVMDGLSYGGHYKVTSALVKRLALLEGEGVLRKLSVEEKNSLIDQLEDREVKKQFWEEKISRLNSQRSGGDNKNTTELLR